MDNRVNNLQAGENDLGNLCQLNTDVLRMVMDQVMASNFNLEQLASMGKLDHVKQKIEELGNNPDGKALQRAIHNAARHGHLDVVQYLFSVLDKEPYQNIREWTKQVALELALKNRQVNVAEYLLQTYPSMLVKVMTNTLFFLSANGYVDMLRLLVTRGANIITKNNIALTAAVDYGHMNVVKYLFEELPEDQRPQVLDALTDACAHAAGGGHLEMVRYLFEKDTQGQIDRYEAMDYAASEEKLDVLEFLLEYRRNDAQNIRVVLENAYRTKPNHTKMIQMLKDAYCATLGPNS